VDPYAAALLATAPASDAMEASPALSSSGGAPSTLLDVAATKWVDEALLNAVAATSVSRVNSGDFRQVVLLGDGMDTRPFRLPWPEGTLLFIVAPPEVHELAEAVLGAAPGGPARVPRGCLMRRVNADLGGGASFMDALAAAGYRGDRLSAWGVQGLRGAAAFGAALADAANCMAFHSLAAGELPEMGRREAENALAACGLLGALYEHEGAAAGYASLWSGGGSGGGGGGGAGGGGNEAAPEPAAARRWLFTGQQLRPSFAEMGVLGAHTQAAEETDEDYFDNFS
jgi:hypothetical protein